MHLSHSLAAARRTFLIACALCELGGGGPAVAAPTVFLHPPRICGELPGTTFNASIWLDGSGDRIGCFHLLFTYDRTRLTLLSATEGDLFRLSGQPTFFVWEYPTRDTTAFTDCLLGSGTYVLGPGELVKLRFRIRACPPDTAGLFQVERRTLPPPVDYAFLADQDRQNIPGVVYLDSRALLCNSCVNDAPEGSATPPTAALTIRPNPASESARIGWSLGGRQLPARLEIFGADGRRVLEREILAASGTFLWDLRDETGARTAAGAYFARISSRDATLTRKILTIR